MTSMFKFLKRKIKPFKKCTGNPSYSFEAVDKFSPMKPAFTTFVGATKKQKKGFFNFKKESASNKKCSISSSDILPNNTTNCQTVSDSNFEDIMFEGNGIDTELATFETPTSSMNSNLVNRCPYGNEWESQSYSDDMLYSDEDCIQDLIDHTNQVLSPGQHSMKTYNTKFADNSHLLDDDKASVSLHQYTPFDEIESSFNQKRRSTVMSDMDMDEFSGFKKSKTFQNHQQLLCKQKQCSDSPVYKKLDLKQNRKCRRSNTTFTMAGMRKNKIIEYFNNLELNKPISKGTSKQNIFSSNREIYVPRVTQKPEVNSNNTTNETSIDDTASSSCLSQSKTENEKIQDLFFYDESLLSNRNESRIANLTADSVISVNNQNVLSTFLDSPISDKSMTPVLLIQRDVITSTNNSVERLRRSNSMTGANEPNLSIQANTSKINAVKSGHEDDSSIITPKKVLNFNHTTNSIETPNIHYTTSFEVCDDTDDCSQSSPNQFIRGQTRNLSKNIKKMFKNVIKLQMDALANLEHFYEAQLLKVETDRKQNLQVNPSNKQKINEFFDKQLELLEERVHINLENITKEKQSTSSLKVQEFQDTSVIQDQKKIFTKKLAQIISNNQNCNISNGSSGRRSQSKNLMELKNNLISQKSLLPSKVIGGDWSSSSPRKGSPAGFKRNLSLPFKQCRQNYQRVRNESAHESALNNLQIGNLSADKFGNNKVNDSAEFSYNKNRVKAYEITQRCMLPTSLAKIVKLNTDTTNQRSAFTISSNSAFSAYNKPKESITKTVNSHKLIANNSEAYEEISQDSLFVPSELDIRRNSSVFYKQQETDSKSIVALPRLSDSHLLFRIKQEKRMNDKNRLVCTYQKQFKSKCRNFGHVETEV